MWVAISRTTVPEKQRNPKLLQSNLLSSTSYHENVSVPIANRKHRNTKKMFIAKLRFQPPAAQTHRKCHSKEIE